jgi:hypothetical protein
MAEHGGGIVLESVSKLDVSHKSGTNNPEEQRVTRPQHPGHLRDGRAQSAKQPVSRSSVVSV